MNSLVTAGFEIPIEHLRLPVVDYLAMLTQKHLFAALGKLQK